MVSCCRWAHEPIGAHASTNVGIACTMRSNQRTGIQAVGVVTSWKTINQLKAHQIIGSKRKNGKRVKQIGEKKGASINCRVFRQVFKVAFQSRPQAECLQAFMLRLQIHLSEPVGPKNCFRSPQSPVILESPVAPSPWGLSSTVQDTSPRSCQ